MRLSQLVGNGLENFWYFALCVLYLRYVLVRERDMCFYPPTRNTIMSAIYQCASLGSRNGFAFVHKTEIARSAHTIYVL